MSGSQVTVVTEMMMKKNKGSLLGVKAQTNWCNCPMKDLRGLPWHLAWLFSAGFEKCVSMYRLKTTLHYQVMHDDKTKYLEAMVGRIILKEFKWYH